MDQRLAVEAEGAALTADAVEAVRIVDVVVDAVDDGKPVGARGGTEMPERGGKIEPVRRVDAAEFLDEIVRAHDEAGEPAAGARDRPRCSGSRAAFPSSPRRRPARLPSSVFDVVQILRRRDLGHEDRVGPRVGRGLRDRPRPRRSTAH